MGLHTFSDTTLYRFRNLRFVYKNRINRNVKKHIGAFYCYVSLLIKG